MAAGHALDWLSSGRVVDIVLAAMLIEALALAALHDSTGRGLSARDLAPTMIAGALLLLAVRAALIGAPATVPIWLAAALFAHVADLASRWRR